MLEKEKRWICKFIVLSILISGMCFENVKADSIFVYTTDSSSDSYLCSSEDTILAQEVCTTEMLGVRTASSMQQLANRVTNNKRELRFLLVFMCVVAVLQLFSNFYTTVDILQFSKRQSKTVVLNYIHNMDGKKK